MRVEEREFNNALGTRLREIRFDAGCNLREFGEIIDADASTLCHYEAGRLAFSIEKLIRLAIFVAPKEDPFKFVGKLLHEEFEWLKSKPQPKQLID